MQQILEPKMVKNRTLYYIASHNITRIPIFSIGPRKRNSDKTPTNPTMTKADCPIGTTMAFILIGLIAPTGRTLRENAGNTGVNT